MPISIDETYEAAAKGETSWKRVLLCTEMLIIDDEGSKVCPPPQKYFEYSQYKYNLDILLRYPNEDPDYNLVTSALKKYTEDWEFHM